MTSLESSYEELKQRVKKLSNKAPEPDRLINEAERNFNFSIDMIGSGNLEGYFTQINSAFGKVLGYSEKEIFERPFIKFVHEDDVEKTKQALKDAGNGKKEISIENRNKCKDGSYKWIEWKVLTIVKENKFIALGRDVSEQKEAKRDLQESEERFRNLTETTSDWIWEVDKDGYYTYVSPRIYDILGYDQKEIIGKTPFDLMPPDEADRVSRIFKSVVASQGPLNCLENINIHKDGHPVVLETSGVPIFGSNGKFRGYRGIDRDITERKKIEEALIQSEMRYRALAENCRIGIWQTTLDGYTVYINPAMCNILEIKDQEELHGKTLYDFFDSKNQEIIKRQLSRRKKGVSSTYHVELIGKNGTIHYLMISGAPLYSSGGKIHNAIASCTDITGLKRIEKKLKKARQELESKVYERTTQLSEALEAVKQNEKQLYQRKLLLEKVNKELIETNQAVSVLARNMDKKKEELEKRLIKLCNGKIMPILKRLQKDVYCQKRQADLELVMKYLYDATHDLSLHQEIDTLLTDQEMRVAILIKNGLTSQQIADSLCISLYTVKTHRKNIRKKFKIDNTKINFSSYLKSKLKSATMK